MKEKKEIQRPDAHLTIRMASGRQRRRRTRRSEQVADERKAENKQKSPRERKRVKEEKQGRVGKESERREAL